MADESEVVVRIEARGDADDPVAAWPWRYLLNGVEFFTIGGLTLTLGPDEVPTMLGRLLVDRIEMDDAARARLGAPMSGRVRIDAHGRPVAEVG